MMGLTSMQRKNLDDLGQTYLLQQRSITSRHVVAPGPQHGEAPLLLSLPYGGGRRHTTTTGAAQSQQGPQREEYHEEEEVEVEEVVGFTTGGSPRCEIPAGPQR
jgi:hypothetical protein